MYFQLTSISGGHYPPLMTWGCSMQGWQSKHFTQIRDIKSFHISIFLRFSVSYLIARHPLSVFIQNKSILVTVSLDFTAHKTMYEGESNENLKVRKKIKTILCSMSLAWVKGMFCVWWIWKYVQKWHSYNNLSALNCPVKISEVFTWLTYDAYYAPLFGNY
jgi:hypothetical protein